MPNQCSNLSNYRSFSLCTPFIAPLKPYTTTRLPLFPFKHSFILIGRRSRRRSSSVPLKVAAQSSFSDVVLIETEEHSDGSRVFRFGDASEVVENDDVVKEIESQTEQVSTVVEELDGDQDSQVIIKTDDGGYDSVEGRLVEVADGISNADIGGDIAESETNCIKDLSDNNAESSDTLSDISEKEVLVSQSDANLNEFNNVVESTLDKAKFSVELNEEESSDPTIYLLDNTPNIEKSADPEGTVLKGSDDKPGDPLVSVELESTLVSQTEVVDDLDNVEAEDTSKSDTENVSSELDNTQLLQIEVMNDLDKVETEDRAPSAFPATMPISDIELTDAANEDVEEDLKDMIVNEGTLIDELPPSNLLDIQSTDAVNEDAEEDLKDITVNEGTLMDELPPCNPLDVRLMDAVNEDAEEELQDMNINEATIIDEMSSDQLVVKQPNLDEVSQLQSVDGKDQTMEDKVAEEELQDMNINEATIIDEMSSFDQLVVEQPTLDEVSQLQSVDVKDQTIKDELQQVSTENMEENDFAYVMPVSRIEETDLVVEQEVNQSQSTPLELKPTIQALDIDLQDPSVSVNDEAIQDSDHEVVDVTQPYAVDESQMVESKDTSEGDAQDLPPPATVHVSDVDDINERLQDMNVSEGTSTDEMPTSDPLGAEPTLEVSTAKLMDVKDFDTDERLQDMNSSEGTFIDQMPASDPLGAERTLEVSTTKGMDVSDVDTERLQDMNISKDAFIDEMLTSDSLGAEPTLKVSTTKDMDVKEVDTDESLKDNNISEGTFIDEMTTSDPLGAERTLEVSTTEGLGVKDVDTEERLQDMVISENTFIDEMPTSDPLGAEPTLEVSTTEGLGVKDVAVEAELELVSNDNIDGNPNAEVMPAEPIVEEKASQPHLTPVELKATMKDTDIEVQDATVDDEILQVIGADAGNSYVEDVEESSHRLESQPLQDEGVNHNMLEQCAKTDAVGSSILLKQGAHNPLLEAERTEGMVGSSEILEASEVTALLSAAEAEVEREEIYLTGDILLSGAALLEHPSKALTGGDDAYFVAGSKWLGVANGVSQWSFEGTGPGVYAQELMKTCEEIVLDTSSVPMTNPVELLCRGVKETNMSGSSNVLLAYFNGQDLHVATIGDAGFLIIRHGAVYKKSSPLLHEFHFAVQVDDSDDPLQLMEEYLIELEVGDIVVSATDGLFDNLYEREIAMIVSKSLQAGMKPQEIANILATRAQEVGKSSFVRSPFSDAAQAAGYIGYAGGKPDNVAVIVSLVEKRSNLLAV